ncbi:efflux RND transporter periplasmic adaptor subunit [Mesorhizobium sp. B2-3-5]|nr:efflux RND transporter periplasmic adaptor subunit [Mesorhizobium sp. B2-3-5]
MRKRPLTALPANSVRREKAEVNTSAFRVVHFGIRDMGLLHNMGLTVSDRRAFAAAVAAATALIVAGFTVSVEAAEPPARPVYVMQVRAQDIPMTASISGSIAARNQHDLSFRAGGQVTDILVDVGDRVRKGQVLASLDTHALQASADLAAASVSSAQAQLTEAQANFNRQKALYADGNATRATLDAAQASLDTAKSGLIGAGALAASAEEVLSYAQLPATADGVIVGRSVDAGQVVQAAQPVFTVAEDGPRDAVFQAYERSLEGVPRDVPVKVELLANSTVVATGHVREISPTIDPSSGTVRIKVGLDPGSPFMPLGASATGSIPLPPQHGFALPWSALFRDRDGPAVWMVDTASGTVSLQPVVIGRYLDKIVIIASGLKDGATVVAKGVQLLWPNEKVSPKAEVSQ